MEAKVQSLRARLHRKPKQEPCFPLLLHFNYSQIIRPRCDLLLHKKMKDFDLAEVLKDSDMDFCRKFNLNYQDIVRLKQRRNVEEKDIMWAHVPTN